MSLTIYSEEELKKIQAVEKACLREFIRICEKLQVGYFLTAGSALGAMRHNGFIPWDDDIDVGMTRPDYERFLKEAPALLPSHYHLQTPYNTPTTPYPYTKIRIDGTKFVEYCNRNVQMHHGVYIDIFPFDKVPTSNIPNWIQFYTVKLLIRLFTLRQTPDLTVPPTSLKLYMKLYLRRGLHGICQLIPYRVLRGTLTYVMTFYNHLSSNFYWSGLLMPQRNKSLIEADGLTPFLKNPFEDLQVNLPKQCEAYLTTEYGDWHLLPPPQQRFGHKPFQVEIN